jgi:hypothetical protein
MNVVVVRGRLAADPMWFVDRAGVRIAGFDLHAVTETGRDVVPVSWSAPPAWAAQLAAGDDVVVRGAVRKRFVRAGAASRPFTEVRAEQVVRSRAPRQVERVLAAAAEVVAGG